VVDLVLTSLALQLRVYICRTLPKEEIGIVQIKGPEKIIFSGAILKRAKALC
jgi:hypothetical protein